MLKVANGDIPEIVKYDIQSKNIIPFPYSETSRVEEGITYTVNDNGTILINGTATMASNFYLNKALKLEIGQKYTISSDCNIPFTIEDTTVTQVVNCINVPQTFIAQYETYYVFLTVGKGSNLNNVLVKPQLEIGSTATEYLPYGQQISDVEKIVYNNETVWIKPVNLIKQPYSSGNNTTTGITWTINEDNSITASGTATANSTFNITELDVSNKQVKLSGCPENGSGSTYELYALDTTNSQIYHDYGEGVIFTPTNKIMIYARIYSEATVNLAFKPKLIEYV